MLPESLFAPAAKVEARPVVLDDGSTLTLHFLHLPNSFFELYAMWRDSKDEAVASMAPSKLAVRGVCDEDGQPVLTLEQAERLKRPVLLRLTQEIFRVNGFKLPADLLSDAAKEKPPNGSPAPDDQTSGSGTSSP